MKALITGAGGLVGRHLQDCLPQAIGLSHAELDVCDEASVWQAISRKHVDAVFHCAGINDPDACAHNPALAARVNVMGTRHVASVCGALGIFMVTMSTDYIFDGKPGEVIDESTTPKPLSVFGRTKSEGETAVREMCPTRAIVRTSWLYGQGGSNFVTRTLTRARDNDPIDVTTQASSPTWAHALAPALVELAKRRATGTFHLMNEGVTGRDDWARAILDICGIDPALIRSVDKFPSDARRPHFSGLRNERAHALGITLPAWQESLKTYLMTDPDIRKLLRGTRRQSTANKVPAAQ